MTKSIDLNWDEALTPGNKFNQIPHPDMLSESGFSKIKFITIADENGYKTKQEANIIYDRDYVVAYFARAFKYLFKLDSTVIHEIIDDSIELRKKQIDMVIKQIKESCDYE